VTRAWQRRTVFRCSLCGKLWFQTRGDAQRYLSYRLERPDLDVVNMNAYACPYGRGFHVGHLVRRWKREGKVTA
jgi:uncharacterized protein (DUF736 family)